ncbi:hypothetical protein MDAP_001470 [Mitosporidium daphniae]|uniref:NAD-dependent epimerase/dehydratase domain-containing protein n=1 Tax=Mitosporidium daphniae TaxID=1485682 RepID=A0A098VMU6_9MICR|nr:uncharacterized protein DI09_74p90 [Mitosporidium daphniae]KGG50367.1 hypothetical protein DI09_74p90 [Mitosporidium daphniae]|eukprot:XP_013236808.1 uncharacterized protein DI09_74p90 [Mitosporidium daphniae]
MPHISPKTIIILGGSGFLGRHICELGSSLGHKMISLSRSGGPDTSCAANAVEWRKFDIFDAMPDSCVNVDQLDAGVKDIFSNADAVIHSMGILFEPSFFDYKKILNCNASQLTSTKDTYELINRDSALKLAMLAYQFPSIKTFAFVSACHASFPFIPARYLSAKIEAEKGVSSLDRFRTLIFRPGMISSPDRPITAVASSLSTLFRSIPILPDMCPSWAKAEPLPATAVAKAIICAIDADGTTPSTEIFEIDDIKQDVGH